MELDDFSSAQIDSLIADLKQELRIWAPLAYEAFCDNKTEVTTSVPFTTMQYFGLVKLPAVRPIRGVRFGQELGIDALLIKCAKNGEIYVLDRVFRLGIRKKRADYWIFPFNDFLDRLTSDCSSPQQALRLLDDLRNVLLGMANRGRFEPPSNRPRSFNERPNI